MREFVAEVKSSTCIHAVIYVVHVHTCSHIIHETASFQPSRLGVTFHTFCRLLSLTFVDDARQYCAWPAFPSSLTVFSQALSCWFLTKHWLFGTLQILHWRIFKRVVITVIFNAHMSTWATLLWCSLTQLQGYQFWITSGRYSPSIVHRYAAPFAQRDCQEVVNHLNCNGLKIFRVHAKV